MFCFIKIFIRICSILLLSVLLTQCGGGGSSSGSSGSGSAGASNYTLTLSFERIETGVLNPFKVTVALLDAGVAVVGKSQDLNIVLGRGSLGSVSEVSTGRYEFIVTPSQTGEYAVTVSFSNTSITRTALVLTKVNSAWQQPMAVSGLVNTEGYEDGITISPNGEYLFVQYGPIYFSGIFLSQVPRSNGGCGGDRLAPNRCTHDWIDKVKGPITAPERPGFFDGRMLDGKFLHNANSWAVGTEQSPIFAPSTMFYGFKRQADGSYAEPFYLAFEDENDAIINPSGLSFVSNANGTTTVAFAMDEPLSTKVIDLDADGIADVESLADIFTIDLTFGSNTSLGKFVPSGTVGTAPIRDSFFPSTVINFGLKGINGNAGTQGNPHLYQETGVIKSIWTDDERDTDGDRGDLSSYVLTAGNYLSGSWTKVVLPSAINKPLPSSEIQPFFTGRGLYYTHLSDSGDLPEIYYNAYSGNSNATDYSNNNKWSATEKILEVGAADSIGKITAIGEPTIAIIDNKEVLYFVYGYIRGYDAVSGLADIDMQAGYIKKK